MESNKSEIFKNTFSFLIGCAVLAVIIYAFTLIKGCSRHKIETDKTCTDGKNDTITKFIYQKDWHTITHEHFNEGNTVYTTIPANVDTEAVIKSYFSKYSSCDTIKDKDLIGVLYYTINKNKMLKDSFIYKILRPDIETIISNTIIPKPKNCYFLGFNTGFIMPGKNFGFGPEVLIITKKNKAIGLGYDALNKTISAKFLIKL